MPYKYSSLDNRRKAKRHLEKLLKEVADTPKSLDMDFKAESALGKSSAYYMKLENVEGVHVYNEGPERWYADIVLKNVPDGISQVMGIPVKSPVATQQEAWNFAKMLLLMLRDTDNKYEKPTNIVFELDHIGISIPMDIFNTISKLKEKMPGFEPGYIEDLLYRARERFGGKLTHEALNKSSSEDKSFLMMACTFALIAGLNRWPKYVYNEDTDRGSSPWLVKPEDLGLSDEDFKSGKFPDLA